MDWDEKEYLRENNRRFKAYIDQVSELHYSMTGYAYSNVEKEFTLRESIKSWPRLAEKLDLDAI